MRESIKSLMSFSWAMTLFGARQLQNVLAPPRAGGAADAFRAVAQATEEQLTGPIKDLFQAGERMQQGLIDSVFGAVPASASRPTPGPAGPPPAPPPPPRTQPRPALRPPEPSPPPAVPAP